MSDLSGGKNAMWFILKSVFWLSLAFAVLGPGFNAANLPHLLQQTTEQGSHLVAESALECTSIECLGGHAVVSAGIGALSNATMPLIADIIPLPRPRPERI
jgi:hypothetical protein